MKIFSSFFIFAFPALLAFLSAGFCNSSFSQSNAPAIITTDCDGNTYDLYDKLNSGKIIVIGWVMPCGSCTAAMLSVHNAVVNFAVSHPNTVELWVADDVADTPCATLKVWTQNNGINYASIFSTTDLDMMDFGSIGMPKAVVIGCIDGTVFYNVDYNPDGAGVTAAINTILNGGCAVAVNDKTENPIKFNVYPNPGNGKISLSFTNDLNNETFLTNVYSVTGELVYSTEITQINNKELEMDLSFLSPSVYLIRLTDQKGSAIQTSVIIE
jgi:hypothetical protein